METGLETGAGTNPEIEGAFLNRILTWKRDGDKKRQSAYFSVSAVKAAYSDTSSALRLIIFIAH